MRTETHDNAACIRAAKDTSTEGGEKKAATGAAGKGSKSANLDPSRPTCVVWPESATVRRSIEPWITKFVGRGADHLSP
ncbi:MAG: hypothetical protein AAF628_25970 [Planctomycetota bacterium]